MISMLKNKKSDEPNKKPDEKLPVLFSDFFAALGEAIAAMFDTDAVRDSCDPCYAVLKIDQATRAITRFCIAVCADFVSENVCVTEEERHICMTLDMRFRHKPISLSAYAPFTSEAEYLRFSRYAKDTDLTLSVTPTGKGFLAKFSFVRFRANEYRVASVDLVRVADVMYQTLSDRSEK